jgi:hypothetical protein
VAATGSTRTAMRWPSSSLSAVALAIGLAALTATLGACGLGTRVYFLPSSEQERIGQNQLRDRADALVRAECPRLTAGQASATAASDFRLTVDRTGDVTRADLTRSSGDERVDAMFGALVAQLRFDPPRLMRDEEQTAVALMAVGYSCSPTVQVATVQLKP